MNHSAKKILQVLGLITMTVTTSCRITTGTTTVSPSGASRLAEVKVNLPPSNVFKPSQGTASVNALHLTVKPKDPSCANPTIVDETRSYADAALTQKFRKGCDYFVSLALGEKTQNNTFKVYYRNEQEKLVAIADLEQDPVRIDLNLLLTNDGRTAYMPERLEIPTQPNNNNGNPAQPTPPPTAGGLAPLPQKLQVKLIGPNNQSVDLSSIFTTEYLLIDFSQLGCGPCIEHARTMNQAGSGFQTQFSGSGKCKSMIVISSADTLSDWISTFGANTFVGKSSFSYQSSFHDFAELFGKNISATPTFLLIDRQGKTLAVAEGAMPQAVDNICK